MRVDLPEPVWPMMPTNSPREKGEIHLLNGIAFKGRPHPVGMGEISRL